MYPIVYRIAVRVAGMTVLGATLLASATALHAAELAGSEWQPAVIGEILVPSDMDIFVRFEPAGKLNGHGGCNRFLGTYRISGSRVEICPLAATRMACPESVMNTETDFVRALETAKRFKRDRTDLDLLDENDVVVITLTQRDAD